MEQEDLRPLNSWKRYLEKLKEDPCELSAKLANDVFEMLQNFRNHSEIDFASLRSSHDYFTFALQTCKLQKVKERSFLKKKLTYVKVRLGKLPNDKKLLFWVNISFFFSVFSYCIWFL